MSRNVKILNYSLVHFPLLLPAGVLKAPPPTNPNWPHLWPPIYISQVDLSSLSFYPNPWCIDPQPPSLSGPEVLIAFDWMPNIPCQSYYLISSHWDPWPATYKYLIASSVLAEPMEERFLQWFVHSIAHGAFSPVYNRLMQQGSTGKTLNVSLFTAR